MPGVCLAEPGLLKLVDATEKSGIRFRHDSPSTKQRHTHLVMGSGVGWVDFDRDDLPDLFVAQGTTFRPDEENPRRVRSTGGTSDRLFRNLGNEQFADVSQAAGLDDVDYTMGVAVGDFDNDGFPDIYVTNYGRNRLLRNNGDGTFTEIGAAVAVDDPRFGASATWVDLDNDGNLDLFVVNYLKLDRDDYQLCKTEFMGRQYPITCHPRSVPPEQDVVYRNEGDGRFSDWTATVGLASSSSRQGLGVVAADYDSDGDVDVYVANDAVPNQLWINRGDGTLQDEGLISGTALNRKGEREAGMGVVAGDVDGDGRADLFVTNYFHETNTLYRNEGAGLFLDVTEEMGLGAPSRLRLGFGTSLCDFDNDGWLDLFVANGHVHEGLEVLDRDEPFAQRPQLFRNQKGRRFEDGSNGAGEYFQRAVVGRGCAVADYDRDGRQDLAVLHLNGPLVLLHNESAEAAGASSLQIELVGRRSNRDAIGAVVEVQIDDRRLTRLRTGSASYLSCDESRLTIGIGRSARMADVSVRWPGGKTETWKSLQLGMRHVLIEGAE